MRFVRMESALRSKDFIIKGLTLNFGLKYPELTLFIIITAIIKVECVRLERTLVIAKIFGYPNKLGLVSSIYFYYF